MIHFFVMLSKMDNMTICPALSRVEIFSLGSQPEELVHKGIGVHGIRGKPTTIHGWRVSPARAVYIMTCRWGKN